MTFAARLFRCLALVVGLAAWGTTAHAACSSPQGEVGAIIYSATHNMPAYCDGTNWVAMGGSLGGGGASALSGLSDVNTTGASTGSILSFDGTNWVVSSTAAAGVAALSSLTDVTLTNLAGRDYLRYDAVTSKWVNISESTVMSTTTMLNGWPDAIHCNYGNGEMFLPLAYKYVPSTEVYYSLQTGGSTFSIIFNANTQAYTSHANMAGSNCLTKSISQLYAEGKAFNFIGNANTGSGDALGDRITSGTLAMVANSDTSYVSLSTNGTTWGYLNSGLSYLPALSAGRVNSTNISASIIQVGNTGASCTSGISGSIRFSSVSSTMEYCNSTTWVSMGPSDTVVPAFSVHKNGSNQSVTASTWTLLTWSTEAFDSNNNFASNRFTPTIPGFYLFTGNVGCGSATNGCGVSLYKNGSRTFDGGYSLSGSSVTRTNLTALLWMNGTTDYVELWGYNGGSTSINGDATATWFEGALLTNGGGGGGGASALSGLLDVNTSGATTGSIIAYNGSSWVVSSTAAAGASALASLTDVSATSPLDNQILRYNASQTKWEAVSASDAVFSCPSGYALVSAAGRAYGCIKTTETAATTCAAHINTCMAEGARLPTLTEFKMAQAQYGYTVANYAYLENAAGDNDCAGITSGGRPYGIGDTGNYPARCFIPAVGIVSSTSGGSALGDRITSGTVSVTTNPNGYVSLTTGGVDWGYLSSGLSYLPTLGSGRVSATNISASIIQVGNTGASCSSGISGSIRYSIASSTVQVCNGSAWVGLGGGASALGGLADVQLSNLSGRDYLRYDFATSKWVNISESTVMSTTTMLSEWPDAIVCGYSSMVTDPMVLYLGHQNYTSGRKYYYFPAGSAYAIFDTDGTYNSGSNLAATGANPCTSGTTISSLYATGRAFNFIGNANTGGGALGDRIISGTNAVTMNSSSGYVSLSSSGTDWGYLSSGASYLPAINSVRVSATNISSSIIQVGNTGASCSSGISGSLRYSTANSVVEYCNSTAWVSMGPSATQPISFRATNGSAQTLAAATLTKLNFATEEFDTNNNFASSRFTATVPGKYLFSASALFTSVTGGADIYIFKNGTYSGIGSAINGNVTKSGLSTSGVLDLAVNDYVELYGWANSGSPSFYASYNHFSGVLLSPQGSGGGSTALSALSDVNTGGATAGSTLAYNGSQWVISSTGGNGAVDNITSGTLAMVANSASSVISLSTAGTTWGYLGSGNSYLPTLAAGRVSATNVSATTIEATGNVTAFGYFHTSDKRAKENIIPLTGGLSKLDGINPISFSFISDTSHTRRLGVIAQDVEKVYPEAVIKGTDGYLKVDYTAFVPVLIDAVKELKAQNEIQRQIVDSYRSLQRTQITEHGQMLEQLLELKAANDNLQRRLDALEERKASVR